MKSISIVILVLLPILGFSQKSAVVIFPRDTIIGTIHQTTDKYIFFTGEIESINSNRIPWSNVSAVLGDLDRIRIKAISKKYPDIKFDPWFQLTLPPSKISSSTPNFDYMVQPSVGDYLKKSGQQKLSGLGVALLTSGIVAVGSNTMKSEQIAAVGIAGVVLALNLYVFGEINLIRAGKKMNMDALSLRLSDQGLGVSVKF